MFVLARFLSRKSGLTFLSQRATALQVIPNAAVSRFTCHTCSLKAFVVCSAYSILVGGLVFCCALWLAVLAMMMMKWWRCTGIIAVSFM